MFKRDKLAENTNRGGMMALRILGLCRGDGKGYVKINTRANPDTLRATAKMTNGSALECPIVPLSFPGEDATARSTWGDTSDNETHESVVVVPLLDNAKLTVCVEDKATHTKVGLIPFNPLETKIKSRLTYHLRSEFTTQIRDIEQRRISGIPHTYVTGIFPIGDQRYSCRFCVCYPYFGQRESCDVSVYDDAAYELDLKPIVLEDSLISNPDDNTCKLHKLMYSVIVTESNKTLCIQAKPENQSACFTCILPPMFDSFVSEAYNLTQHASCDDSYRQWFERHRSTAADIHNQRKICESWAEEKKPLISIVTVVFRPPVEYLRALIDSFIAQSYINFEVIFVNVSGDDTESKPVNKLLNDLDDSRFHIVTTQNKSIADNTNVGIREAHGEYIAFVDHDDVIEPDALYHYVSALHNNPIADVLYCDEDLLDEGQYIWPTFKPAYNPDLLNSHNYVTHMLMLSRHVLDQVELSPTDVSGAQDYDLTLKCSEKARAVVNVPHMLYHWRVHQDSTSTNPDSKPYAEIAGKLALERHFKRTGLSVEVFESELPFCYRNRYNVDVSSKVSIIIPSQDNSNTLRCCIDSILTKTEYKNYDIILVESNSSKQEIFTYYDEIQKYGDKVKVVTWQGIGFNHSAVCNYGASQCDGEILLFLSNNMDVINKEWLDSMSNFFARPEVGAVGAKLLFPDNLVQHGGMWASSSGIGFLNSLLPSKEGGYMETLRYPYNCTAVSSDCQMVRRSAFSNVGGFDEELAGTLGGVDLCLRLSQAGYLTVFDPQAQLYRKEHADHFDTQDKQTANGQARFRARWYGELPRDQYINRNLNPYDTGHFKIA